MSTNNIVVSLPPPLEFGENPKVFASLYELDIEQTVIFDTSAVLTARRVAEVNTATINNNNNDSTIVNTIDFSATSFTSEENANQKKSQNHHQHQYDEENDDNNNQESANSKKEEDANTKLARQLLSEMGGRTVAFDRVHSGDQTRTTELVESLLPYALSTGSSSLHNTILFVNNFGASESPFQARGRGETSIVYQILANMHPWIRRRSCDLEASLIAWDSWGDAIDLFSARNTAAYEHASRNYSSPFHSGMATPHHHHDANENGNNNGNYSSNTSNFHSSEPLQFTGMNRLFDDLCVNKIVMPGEQHHLHGFISSKNNNNNQQPPVLGPSSSSSSSSSIFNQQSTTSRYKTVSDLCDSVEWKVSAFRRQIVSSAFSKDASVSSNSNDYRYAICLRLDCVPIGIDADDELTWGTLCIIECSGSMLCQARSSRRGVSPSLLSTVKALYLPADEPPIRLASTTTTTATNNANPSSSSSSSLLYPLQSLAQLPQRPELSLASFVVGPTCTARLAMVLPVPRISYGSSALFVQASVDALCVIARRDWITYPEQPPTKTVDTPLKLFAHAFERKVKEATQLRWLSRKYRNCRVGTLLVTQQDEDQKDDDHEEEQNNFPGSAKQKFASSSSLGRKQNIIKNNNNNNSRNHAGGDDKDIPAIDAWIIAMQRRLASLEEVEVEQHQWHAWLEDYREWLLSIPASGNTHGVIRQTEQQAKENHHPSSSSSSASIVVPQTISWSERCELLERVVAQQQEEMRRVKRICLRDIENLREEVAILRSQSHNHAVNNKNGSGGGEEENMMMMMTSSSVPSQSNPTLRELRGILQGFEFDVISLKNNSATSSIPPEEVQFEMNGMIERLKRDVDSVVRPFFPATSTTHQHQHHQNNIVFEQQHFVQSLPWILPRKVLEPDQQTVFRHERLRLRALAGALARGCDDLASRIHSVVELNSNNTNNSRHLSDVKNAENTTNKKKFSNNSNSVENEEYFLSSNNDDNNINNRNPSARRHSSSSSSNVLHDSDLSPIRDSDGSNYTGAESLMQNWGLTKKNTTNTNSGNSSSSRPAFVTGNKPFSVNPLARKKYSNSVLSAVHEQWCKDVAATLRNTAENIASDLDGEIIKSGFRQDSAITELCARFFANRASHTISSFGSNHQQQQQQQEGSSSSALSNILSQQQQQTNGKGRKGSTTPIQNNNSNNLNSGRDVIPRINAVNLQSITGNNRLMAGAASGGAEGGGMFGSAALKSNRFRKGLFSSGAAANSPGAGRAQTPRAVRR